MKKPLSKQALTAIIIIAVLTIAFGALLTVYLIKNRDNREIYQEQKIRILVGEQLLGEYTFEELSELAAEKNFSAVYKPSGKKAISRQYSGIELRELFAALSIDLMDKQDVRFTASDGKQQIYRVQDVLAENNVFVARKVEGEYFNSGIDALAYTKPQEDGGPYVVIRAKDTVSQYRVKLLVEICVI